MRRMIAASVARRIALKKTGAGASALGGRLPVSEAPLRVFDAAMRVFDAPVTVLAGVDATAAAKKRP